MSPPEPHRAPFARALDALHLLGISYFLAMAMAGFARGADLAGTAILAYGALLAATAAVAGRAHRPGPVPAWFRHLHLWWSLVVLTSVFAALRWLVPSAAPPGRQFDDALAALDQRLFGVDVARWSEGFLTPGIADVFMVFYVLYFAMPVATLVALVRREDRGSAYRSIFIVTFGLYACYALYLLVPAAGPRHAYVGRSAPLPQGHFTGFAHDFILHSEPQPFDAFPSAHVVMGLLCAAITWPLGGWLRWTMAAVGAGTTISTVVLRYHYVVDDVVALGVVGAALLAARLLDARIARKAAASHADRMGDLLGGG